MFRTIVVALDLEADGDRALPVVRSLTDLADVSVELLTVSSPNLTEAVDDFELSRRAAANGWPAHSYAVVHADDAARAIVDHVGDRDDVLLVMATSAKRPLFGHLLGSVGEAVLRLVDRPVLLVGPHVPDEAFCERPTPILCVVAGTPSKAAMSAVEWWTQTFPGAPPQVVEVTGGRQWHSATRQLVHRSTDPVLVVPSLLNAG